VREQEPALGVGEAHAPLDEQATHELVLAVPVLDERMFARLAPQVDGLVALATVPAIQAVGLWYDRFEPVLDAQVLDLLAGARGLGRITGPDEIRQGSA
jgi:predicted phosphoribosyltransferase